MNKIGGSMEMLSAMQLTKDMAGLDAQSKMILHNKEVLAIILQDTVEEYKGYSRKEIMDYACTPFYPLLEIFAFFKIIAALCIRNPLIDILGPVLDFFAYILFKLLAREVRKVRLYIVVTSTVYHNTVNRVFCRAFYKY